LAKAWCIAITAALLATNDGNPQKGIFLITTFSAVSFWFFDAYYLSLERKFVRMFGDVADSQGPTNFFMDPKAYVNDYANWQAAMYSNSMIIYWGLILTGGLFYFMPR
jgi:hypothetical protein